MDIVFILLAVGLYGLTHLLVLGLSRLGGKS